MFAKTIAALKAAEVAAKAELDALWVEFDPKSGTGGVHWNSSGAGILGDALAALVQLRTALEPKQAFHEEAQAAAQAAEEKAKADAKTAAAGVTPSA
jgi:hypothetical protein